MGIDRPKYKALDHTCNFQPIVTCTYINTSVFLSTLHFTLNLGCSSLTIGVYYYNHEALTKAYSPNLADYNLYRKPCFLYKFHSL